MQVIRRPINKTAWVKALGAAYDYAKYVSDKSMVKHASDVGAAMRVAGVKRKLFQDEGKRKVKIMQTPGKTVVRPRRTGAVSSRSGGKLTSSRYRIRKRDRMAANGVSGTYEVGRELITTNQVLWIGHNVVPYTELRSMMWRLILKKLVNKTGLTIKTFGAVLDSISIGDLFILSYTTGDGANATLQHTVAAGNSWENIAATFYNNAAVNNDAGITWRSLGYVPIVNAVGTSADRGPARLDFEYLYVKVYAKSTMKIQNRTVNGTDNQTDEVDNVPLYGRTYAGVGNGTTQNTNIPNAPTIQLIADRFNGLITGTGLDPGQDEPLPQVFFPYVTQKGKIHLDPGVIKTSTLVYKTNMLLTKLKERLANSNATLKDRNSLGKFRFFALERMIQTAGSQSITAGLEINHYLSLDMYSKVNNVTQPVNVFNYA